MDNKANQIQDLQLPIELVGRQNELNLIIRTLKNDEDLLITGAPGNGRFTLVRQAAKEANARLLSVNCLQASSGRDFINLLLESMYQAFNMEMWDSITKSLMISPNAKEIFVLDFFAGKSCARLAESLNQDQQENAFKIAVSSIQKIIDKTGGRAVVLLERLFHIRSWDRKGKWENFLRKTVNSDSEVSYIIFGTIAEAMEENFEKSDNNIKILELRPLPKEVVIAWSKSFLQEKDLCFDLLDGSLDLFLDIVQGHIGDARTLAKYVRADCREGVEVKQKDVYSALSNLLEDFSATFESILLMLPYSQVQLLECLAIEPTSQPHKKEYLNKYNLARGGTLQSALKGLQNKGLIYDSKDQYQLTLPILAHWLKKNRNSRPFNQD